tara:strand:+ start:129 stop:539 length:411 start_codon:yes stop_codon:yes gene_type:complete
MKNLVFKIEGILNNFEAIASLLLRLGVGIAFIIHGYNKFPLPPESLIDFFDLSPALASAVALSELFSGIILIIGGFIKNPYGNILTRLAGFSIVVLMVNIFAVAHTDWFINKKLFTNPQIFLFIGGIYFLIKGNRK